MSKATSPFYPPRARWYAPVFQLAGAVQRGMALDRIYLPPSVTWQRLALSFLIPGLGFYLRAPRLYGRMAMAACGLLFLVFIACFGESPGNFAFGLIISIHTSGIAYYCGPALQMVTLRDRLLFTIVILMALGFLYYGPLRDIIQNNFLMPLQINGRVVVVEKLVPAETVRRGDWIAYRIPKSLDYGDDEWIRIHSGVGFGPVLAVAGDTVEFSAHDFSVNGVGQSSLPDMPTGGSFVVAQHQWFIWPSYSIRGHGYENQITSIMLKLANISENQYAGKPFKRWFWRRQILP